MDQIKLKKTKPMTAPIAQDILWDVIVVGTGMGGATTGYELARKGQNVLFIEKGKFLFEPTDRGDGKRSSNWNDDPDSRLSRGNWPQPIQGSTSFGDLDFFAPLGSGTGGGTSLYAAQLERFLPCDFKPRTNYREIDDSTLPESWPIDYYFFEKYYRLAESLYRVRGTHDPKNHDREAKYLKPPTLSERDQFLTKSFQTSGLNPYRAHVACEFVINCNECGGLLCPHECKNDSAKICLKPALENHDASILTDCEVLHFEADSKSIKSVICKINEKIYIIKGRIIVLAAGSLFTPVLLLKSKSEHWPNGLANNSGFVGRNLMWHATDFIAVRPKMTLATIGPKKALSLNDFYNLNGLKLGNVQSVGVPVNADYIYSFLISKVQKASKWKQVIAHRSLLFVISQLAAYYFKSTAVFALITEDLPYFENRVIVDPLAKNGMRFNYKYSDDLRFRCDKFFSLFKELLKSNFRILKITGKNNINFGHACGTCRFGADPKSSVLRWDNRAHDVDNLYITDASFFPSSGGTNPSLTIAANAIRVAEIINQRLIASIK